jgi:diguanylate cyclase (GGDEF)-like protein/PAS domain S-box-containing protein
MGDSNYLKDELYTLVSNNQAIFEFLQNGSLDGLWYWDLEKPENEWMNSRFWELLGYDPSEKKHLAREWQDIINKEDLDTALENFKKHCENESHPYDQIVRYQHKNGKTIWVRCRGIAIRDAQGKPIRMLGAHNDITELKEYEQELKMLAGTDVLTGLANRRSFIQHFDWIKKSYKRNFEPFCISMIDIDNFKNINDTLGHEAGDSALVLISSSITKTCRETDFIARWGGDEFIVILHGTSHSESIETIERVRKNVSQIIFSDFMLSISAGVRTVTDKKTIDRDDLLDSLVHEADKALFVAKSSGRNCVISFEK